MTEEKSEGQQALDLSPQIPWGTEGSREREKNQSKKERRCFSMSTRKRQHDLHVYLDDQEYPP